MSDLDEFKDTFFEECAELLTELDAHFAALAAGARDPERLNAVFRAIHSIKGGGGAFGFSGLVDFAHGFETLLDHARASRIPVDIELVRLCIRATDIVADFVAAARTGVTLDPDFGSVEQARFRAYSATAAAGPQPVRSAEEVDVDYVPVAADLAALRGTDPGDTFLTPPVELRQFTVRFRPHPTLYARANDPLLLLRELASLGEVDVFARLEDLPALADFEPFGVYCAWEVRLTSEHATLASIRDVFEFVEGDCDIEIEQDAGPRDGEMDAAAPDPGIGAVAELDALFPPDEHPFATVAESSDGLEDAGAPADLTADLPSEQATFAADAKQSAPEPKFEPAPAPEPLTPAGPAEAEAKSAAGLHSIRVDLEKVDRVVNMVGELVITQSMLTQQLDETLRSRYQELVRGLEVLAQTARGLQDAVMAIRAQPVRSVFSRMPRLLRELAAKTGKQIRLETSGDGTEIDKSVIEQLADPLTHMLRNSADHGIELPPDRRRAGKPECGTIRLAAEQSGGNILITVEDDGAGIDRSRVLAIARRQGLVAADAQPGDEVIDNLIFLPGFSTASAVTDLSGRGVGLDVVLSNIRRLGGSVQVRSWPGKGTRLTLRLPLTLAVLDVMQVRVAGCPYVIPLSTIVETLEAGRADFGRVPSGAPLLRHADGYVQVVDLASRFGLPRAGTQSRFVVLCETDGAHKLALLVDDIVGQQQVVIKSLEENFEHVDGIAGGTILGDGNVALIIDVAGLGSIPLHKHAA